MTVAPQTRIMVLCGKGGVGKTTLSLALALKLADRGHRAVVVSSHPIPELAIAVSLDGLAVRFPTAARNMFVVYLDPRALLQELVEKNFPLPGVARMVLNSSIFRNLVEVAPGLKEFYFLVRLQQLAERKSSPVAATPEYDFLIWDAPASGHFLSTLRSARAFETYLSGPLAALGAELDRFFSNSANIEILAVTPLEEMALTEAIEMTGALQRDFHLRCSALLLNMVSPLVTAKDAQIAELHIAPDASAGFRFAVERGLMERERRVTIASEIRVPQVLIPRVTDSNDDLDLLEQIGRSIELAEVVQMAAS